MRVPRMRQEGRHPRSRGGGLTAPAVLVALAALAVLAGCAGPAGTDGGAEPEGTDPTVLEGAWELVSGTGPDGEVEPVETHPVTLEIEGDGWRGTAACNTYDAEVSLDDDRLHVDGLGATEMACEEDGVMESEAAFLAALREVESWSVPDGRLVLEGPGTELVFQRS